MSATTEQLTKIKDLLRTLSLKERDLVKEIITGASQGNEKLLDEVYKAVYKQRKPPIDEFVYGNKYLGLPKSVIFPRIFDVLVAADASDVREVDIIAGKGSGKSTVCSIVLARGLFDLQCFVDPAAFFNVLPGVFIACVNMSVGADQAEHVIFDKLINLMQRAPCFHENADVKDGEPLFRKVKRHLEFGSNVHALSGHSDYRVFFGYDVFCAVLDEICWMHDTRDHPVSEEIHQGVLSSAETRFPDYYKIVSISTPRSDDDFLFSRHKQAKENGKIIPIGILDGQHTTVK